MALIRPLPDPNSYSFDPHDYPNIPVEAWKVLVDDVSRLRNLELPILKIPKPVLEGFEPSQIGTIVGTLMDACIPYLDMIIEESSAASFAHGLSKAEGILGEREGYPDYVHERSGLRTELKLLYVDPAPSVRMKVPPTPREPSARLTQKVTLKNVEPDRDVLLVLAYQLSERHDDPSLVSPTIIDVGLFPVIDCILARDKRLITSGGRWSGNFETPVVLSKIGRTRLVNGQTPDQTGFGRKESEGYDFNEDTNFGKLKRIPSPTLRSFLKKHKK